GWAFNLEVFRSSKLIKPPTCCQRVWWCVGSKVGTTLSPRMIPYPDRSGISEACEDCGSAYEDCGQACAEGIDSINGVDISGLEVRLGGENFSFENYVWLDPSVRVRR
ncbi:unnamed protein product, partial [Prunus brigantina]